MPKISLIIPVYNVEKYLPRLLESVISQTFHDFEVILVNDASTDNSGKICDQYSKLDSRLTVCHKKYNEGVSCARNTGIDLANGMYICFADSDDILEPYYLESLISSHADLVIAGLNNFYPNGSISANVEYKDEKYENIDSNLICQMIEDKSINYVYSKRYLLKTIKDKKIKFNSDLSLGEDTLFVCEYIINSKTVEFISEKPYLYYQNADVSLSSFSTDYVSKLLTANDKILNVLSNKYDNLASTEAWKKRIWSLFYYSIFQILKSSSSTKVKEKNLDNILKNSRFVELSKNIDTFMNNDACLWRKVISKRNAKLTLLFFKIVSLIK